MTVLYSAESVSSIKNKHIANAILRGKVQKNVNVAILSANATASLQSSASGLSWQCDPLTLDTAQALETEWSDLSIVASEQNIFAYPWFIIPSLPLLVKLKPKLLAIRAEGLLIGLVTLRADAGYAKLPVPFWRTAMHYEQFLGTPLVRAGYENKFAAGLCEWLDQAPLGCCFLNLAMMSADSKVAKAIADHCQRDARQFLETNSFQRAAIVPARSRSMEPEQLLSSSRRKSLRRAMKNLSKQGAVSVERLSKECDQELWMAHFLDMENTGWKRDDGSSILSCANETALYKQIIYTAFRQENLLFSRLCLDGKPIAYTLDIAAGSQSYCLKSAIHQDYRKFSPGVLMEFETLKYYLGQELYACSDSCTSPNNEMLNELWPDRKPIADLLIGRRGVAFSMIFKAIHAIKSGTKPVDSERHAS